MKYLLVILGAWSLSGSCYAGDTDGGIDLRFNGARFAVPGAPTVIASTGSEDDMLILRYGHEKGRRYLTFSNIDKDRSVDLGCRPRDFFARVFSDIAGEACKPELIESFRAQFVQGRETGTWTGKQMTVHYSHGNEISFLFAFDGEGRSTRVDTDFLTLDQLRDMLGEAL